MKKPFKPRVVYHIILDNTPIYVGSTSGSLSHRLCNHKNSPYHSLLRDRRDDLSMEVIDNINTPEELYKEGYHINRLRNEGVELLNVQNPEWRDYSGKYETYNQTYTREFYQTWRIVNKEKYNEYQKEYMRNYRK
jgi:hypothetical protein